jgi:LysM repeat protein/lysophospholipase L1-like esterase
MREVRTYWKRLLLAFTLATGFLVAHSQTIPADSVNNPDYMRKLITYANTYPFLNYQDNFIEWCNYSAIEPFFHKLKMTRFRKLSVLHIGDSHVQADFITGSLRNRFQELFGNGGRGFVFPYAAAGTHSAYDYKTSCTGLWAYARNVQQAPSLDLGITGATVRTSDSSASFRFIFYRGAIREGFTRLRIYVKQSPQSFNLKVKAGGIADTIRVNCNSGNGLPWVELNLPKASDTLSFFVDRTDSTQKFFECYGVMIETPDNTGVLYNSVGINGAGYKSLLRENLFTQQLKDLHPDLIVIDLGGNDFTYGHIYPEVMKSDLMTIIDRIRSVSPESCILITNCQDAYSRRRNVPQCEDFSRLTREVAIAKNCSFYNYYNVSGNRYSMLKWYSNGLAQHDRVHLTYPGYAVKGELYANAILNSYCLSLSRTKNDSLIVAKLDSNLLKTIVDFHLIYKRDSMARSTEVPYSRDTITKPQTFVDGGVRTGNGGGTTAPAGDKIYYTIRSGDNLGSIAMKYHCTVSQLQQWNHLSGTNIIAGKTLVIYRKSSGTTTTNTTGGAKPPATTTTTQKPVVTTTQKPTTTTTTNKSRRYTVVSGDTLWGISRKYNVSVDQIKRANNLRDDNLKIGMVLSIPY